MPVFKSERNGLWVYIFMDHLGKPVFEIGFKSRKLAENAERMKKSSISPKLNIQVKKFDWDRSIKTIEKAMNTIDIVFPSIAIELKEVYEFFAQKKFVPSVSKWLYEMRGTQPAGIDKLRLLGEKFTYMDSDEMRYVRAKKRIKTG